MCYNIVRAGVVSHPSEWKWGGFHEIQTPKTRSRLIDHDMLKRFLNIEDEDELVKIHKDGSTISWRAGRQGRSIITKALQSEARHLSKTYIML